VSFPFRGALASTSQRVTVEDPIWGRSIEPRETYSSLLLPRESFFAPSRVPSPTPNRHSRPHSIPPRIANC
jgi:hypothetical protein